MACARTRTAYWEHWSRPPTHPGLMPMTLTVDSVKHTRNMLATDEVIMNCNNYSLDNSTVCKTACHVFYLLPHLLL